ncbi:hypothetical protein A3844_09450 [Paenibacillus helianthi]|uniref:Uncharacterized protein n=1 Tax=Paenibacillus helianthi TaxID=1349432 RepID=A0ABX3ETN6_9BACL|nr:MULTISPECIES: hypothetical protein [Paenibacillus]OKP73917.1 hypothetical protein A3842_21495 [Paenibacillus sp. P3E]OKP87271.1 hypothetical protein A3848_20140 [Paenibacillus sp. P32E]OKP88023.1 hypothetical protein A3844_09450 [Paenibacillus helianthi]
MECIVHFEVNHTEGVKPLRGLLFLDEGQIPGEKELVDMFKDMKFDVRLDDREKLIFKPVNPGETYSEIRITSFDNGKTDGKEDHNLKSIVGNLLPQKPNGL